jgi:hypothetical protein
MDEKREVTAASSLRREQTIQHLGRWPRDLLTYGICGLVTAILVVYSQTKAFAWDEGFHLLTAQLIGAGKRPYIDWVFSQTPPIGMRCGWAFSVHPGERLTPLPPCARRVLYF